MRERRQLVMAEVRYRATIGRVSPAQSITRGKQRRLGLAASYWLAKNPEFSNWPLRFDVVSISGPLGGAAIAWERGAMEFDEDDW